MIKKLHNTHDAIEPNPGTVLLFLKVSHGSLQLQEFHDVFYGG